ncbi:sulfate ABC transporter substrate-binding protein [Rhodococcus sp. HNM0569]|uniref:sulfate ABC transporter substrate-binding protein n=1 Tax=Rhodococcus sp. HNM0569 TaxID=2716340 RepID=UPI00146C3891|nr:sulfate ABC transporter substrate-binding protein [Rhodococcus sp. HNM0569]NLU84058.1 sulfate ABC transporter substrate-binding protein [Rhodococcus sp. HNM0569]
MRRRIRSALVAVVTTGVLALTSCAGGGPSDVVGGESLGGDGSAGTLNLFAYAVPKPGFDLVIPAFDETDEGEGVAVVPSYGASGDQSRKVKDGAQADVVNFSVEPDVTRLVDAGLVEADWNQDAYGGVPFGSVVTLMVRDGNPKNIRDWNDLLRPDVDVVTPNPFSSGSAKWNLLAPYAAASQGGRDPQAGLDYLESLVGHLTIQPKSGREATESFLQGSGDVLISYENEALFVEREGEPVEHVTPPVTFRVDNPVAVLTNSREPAKARAFRDFLYTPEAQRLWAQAGFRAVDPAVAREYAEDFPPPATLWTIDDLGGWEAVDDALFQAGSGSIARIYENATR